MRGIALLVSTILTLLISCSTPTETNINGEVSIAYLWSLAEERSTKVKSDIYVRGHVVLNDKLGEAEKCIVIADDSGGIEIKIDAERINTIIPLYSEVTLRLSGLSIGREGGKVVVGAHPTGEYVVDRIAKSDILNHMAISLDVEAAPKPNVTTIAEIGLADMLSYVRIEGVEFIEANDITCWIERDPITDRHITTLRHLTDGVDVIRVVVYKDCDYADETLPEGPLNCTGVVDWHDGEIALRISNHRIAPL